MVESFRQTRCAWCGCIFNICRRCDRGQIYCLPLCRRLGRQKSQKEARRRHQQSVEGRKDHADSQRRYRKREKNSVMEHGSKAHAGSGKVTSATVPPPPATGGGSVGAQEEHRDATQPSRGSDRPEAPEVAKQSLPTPESFFSFNSPDSNGGIRCCVCGKRGKFLRFSPLRHRRRNRTRKKYSESESSL